MLKLIKMTVNGKEVETAVDPRESLLDTLRNRLGLTSVKRGCEVGECGACTVLVDGEAIDSCIYLAVWAEGRTILTVEGLRGPNGELSPIQQAFIEMIVVACSSAASYASTSAICVSVICASKDATLSSTVGKGSNISAPSNVTLYFLHR